jgi:hypothetical protein
MKNKSVIEINSKEMLYSPIFECISWKYIKSHSKSIDKVFGVIYRFSSLDDGYCYASVKDILARAIGVTRKSFGVAVKRLLADELIIPVPNRIGNTHGYIVNMSKLEEVYDEFMACNEVLHTCNESTHGVSSNDTGGCNESTHKEMLLRDALREVEEMFLNPEIKNQEPETVTNVPVSNHPLEPSLRNESSSGFSTSPEGVSVGKPKYTSATTRSEVENIFIPGYSSDKDYILARNRFLYGGSYPIPKREEVYCEQEQANQSTD